MVQQALTNQVWRPAFRSPNPNIDVGFAEIDWHELGVAVGKVQQPGIAKGGRFVRICTQTATLATSKHPGSARAAK
jgi:hypothetical protein